MHETTLKSVNATWNIQMCESMRQASRLFHTACVLSLAWDATTAIRFLRYLKIGSEAFE